MLKHNSLALASALVTAALAGTAARAFCQEAVPAPAPKLELKAAIVLDKDFCLTKMKKNHETFEVGKAACEIFKPGLESEFASLTSVGSPQEATGVQAVIVPRFVDLSATRTMNALSDRTLTVLVEWTVKDRSGRTVWIQTVEGSGKAHMGNTFTYQDNLVRIIHNALNDLVHATTGQMNASRELRKLESQP